VVRGIEVFRQQIPCKIKKELQLKRKNTSVPPPVFRRPTSPPLEVMRTLLIKKRKKKGVRLCCNVMEQLQQLFQQTIPVTTYSSSLVSSLWSADK